MCLMWRRPTCRKLVRNSKKLEAAAGVNRPLNHGDDFSFPAMDKMIKENGWICPIKPVYRDNAYYSISKNEIVIPEKRQFKDGESFYTNLGHEMAHSTGSENHLGRLKPASLEAQNTPVRNLLLN